MAAAPKRVKTEAAEEAEAKVEKVGQKVEVTFECGTGKFPPTEPWAKVIVDVEADSEGGCSLRDAWKIALQEPSSVNYRTGAGVYYYRTGAGYLDEDLVFRLFVGGRGVRDVVALDHRLNARCAIVAVEGIEMHWRG